MEALSKLNPAKLSRLVLGLREVREYGLPLTQLQEETLILGETAMIERQTADPKIKVGEAIEKCKEIEHTKLLQKLWRYCSASDIQPAIKELVETGVVDVRIEGRKRVYVWRGLDE
jgi:hypothetical protein